MTYFGFAMPALTPERIKFLNKQLKKLEIQALPSSSSGDSPEYTLVCPEFEKFIQAFDTKSADLTAEPVERNRLSPLELIQYKAELQQNIKTEMEEAKKELYYKELGSRPTLSPKGIKLFRTLSIILLVAGALIPFGSIFMIFGLIGLFFGPKIINHFMKKRFDKKSSVTPPDSELTAELNTLCDTYCVKHKIVTDDDNEAQLFDVYRPTQIQHTGIEPDIRENNNKISQINDSVRATMKAEQPLRLST